MNMFIQTYILLPPVCECSKQFFLRHFNILKISEIFSNYLKDLKEYASENLITFIQVLESINWMRC